MSMRAYTARRRSQVPRQTRARIVAAVRALLEEGTFHESTVEEVAERAGVARATLYQHFGSRLGLVDAMCETFDENPALKKLRTSLDLDEFIANTVDFWATEEKVLAQLYGVAAVDPAAQALVERQRRDRQSELRRLVRGLASSGRLRPGIGERRAFALLSVATSFETFRELRRHAGLPSRDVTRTLQETARTLLLQRR
jgi:AcrR family transcriptional regulator